MMIVLMLSNNPEEILTFPDNGTAANVKGFLHVDRFKCSLISDYNLLTDNYHTCITPYNTETFTYAEHPAPNWEKIFAKFPNTKNIIIKVSDDMILRTIANSHYKQLGGSNYDERMNEGGICVDTLNHEEYVRQIWSDLTHLDEFIELRFSYPYRSHHIIPEQYKDRVYEIELYDIIHNKQKILGVLETVTGIKALPNVHQAYDTYLENQRKLIPWLDDRRITTSRNDPS